MPGAWTARALRIGSAPAFALLCVLVCVLPSSRALSAAPVPENTGTPGATSPPAIRQPTPSAMYPPMFRDASLFRRAMREAAETPPVPPGTHITGLTVPHHLLAAPLMARGFARLRGQQYDRIIILSPDHHSWGKTYFSIPRRDFSTCLGPVPLDRQGAAILSSNPQVASSNLFEAEHGVQALLPFVAEYFPGVPVLPITLRIRAEPADWDNLAASLRPLLSPRALIIQSTDFSHYLPTRDADRKDQETLRVLSGGDLDEITRLRQPEHMDSKAAQYLQLKLQRDVWHAKLFVETVANAVDFLPASAQEKGAEPEHTTSYIVQLYSPDAIPGHDPRLFFGGDFFTGRNLAPLLEQPEKREALVRKVLEITNGMPLVLNFEGVLMDRCTDDPVSLRELRLCMPKEPTLALLRDLRVVAVSLANNHSGDFGEQAYDATRRTLRDAGIAALGQGETVSLPRIVLAAFTDVDNKRQPRARIIQPSDLTALSSRREPGKPLAVMLHYGREFAPAPRYRERALTDMLETNGADIIVGAHPHQPERLDGTQGRLWAWSLGNFLFDQSRKEARCELLEVTFLPRGNYWARQIDLGNVYNELRRQP